MMKNRLAVRCGLFSFAAVSILPGQYLISTTAGGAPLATPVSAGSAPIHFEGPLAVDTAANVYMSAANAVYKLDANGVLTRVAGVGRPGYSGDGGPAISAQINPRSLAADSVGNLYIADLYRLRRVSPSGVITTIAGNGQAGFQGDGKPAVATAMSPASIAVDRNGSVYATDPDNNRIWKITRDGLARVIAGNGVVSLLDTGDGGPAIDAQFAGLTGIAVDSELDVFVLGNSRVREITLDGIIRTVAGGGLAVAGDHATDAQLNRPSALTVDSSNNFYIADSGSAQIRKVSTNGIITTVAGAHTANDGGDGGPAITANLWNPNGLAVDHAGNIYIGDSGTGRIRRISIGGIITSVAGNGAFYGEGGPAESAQLSQPCRVAFDSAGDEYIAEELTHRIRRISLAGNITTIAGAGSVFASDGAQATSIGFGTVGGVAVDSKGNLYFSDSIFHQLWRIGTNGVLHIVAGTGKGGFSGDGAAAVSAQLFSPKGLAVDGADNLYVADSGNNRIRKISRDGIITTVAGTGTAFIYGNGGPAVNATLNNPQDLAFDRLGNLYIADTGNDWIRKVSGDGTITLVAGNGTDSPVGEGGPALDAGLIMPTGIAVDNAGNVFVSEPNVNRVRRISKSLIDTIAGSANGVSRGYSGDGGLGSDAQLNGPLGLASDNAGNVYIADCNNNVIRKLSPTSQRVIISSVVDAASERAIPVAPGKIIVIYGDGLGPDSLVQNQPISNVFSNNVAGTSVRMNDVSAPVIYASATQVAAIVPYELAGSATAQITTTFNSQTSVPFSVPVAGSAPAIFSLNGTGSGQAAAVNLDGSINDAAHAVNAGSYISLFATGEGQTTPGGVNGALAMTQPYPTPNSPVEVTVDGIRVTPVYAGAAPTEVAGLMQVVIQIPAEVAPGGYVPVTIKVGDSSSIDGAVWIAVSAN